MQKSAASELEALPVRFKAKASRNARPHWFSGQFWRWVLPIAGVGAAAAVLVLAQRPFSQGQKPPERVATRSSAPTAPSGSPTVGSLARYRKALDQTGEGSLDSLLARDADLFLRAPSRRELQQLRSELF